MAPCMMIVAVSPVACVICGGIERAKMMVASRVKARRYLFVGFVFIMLVTGCSHSILLYGYGFSFMIHGISNQGCGAAR